MSRSKRISDHLTIPLERGQRARWQSTADLRARASGVDLAGWIGPILDAAADYERAVGRSAAEMLQLMVPIPLRPLLRAPGRPTGGPGTEISVPTVGASAAAVAATAVTPSATAAAAPAEDVLPAAETLPVKAPLASA